MQAMCKKTLGCVSMLMCVMLAIGLSRGNASAFSVCWPLSDWAEGPVGTKVCGTVGYCCYEGWGCQPSFIEQVLETVGPSTQTHDYHYNNITCNQACPVGQTVTAHFEVRLGQTSAPAAVTNLAVVADHPTKMSVQLTWTAPTCSESIGRATRYDIRYATSIITRETWDAATQVSYPPVPAEPGTPQTLTVTGLAPDTLYYFALKSFDSHSNASSISNSPSARTLRVDAPGPAIVMLQILPTPPQVVEPGRSVSYQVKARVSPGDNQGLASVCFDVETDTGVAQPLMERGPEMEGFVAPAGFASPTSGGFGGTVSSDDLRDIGGAQNTIGNDGNQPNPAYPSSTGVSSTLGQAADVVIATGQITLPAQEGTYTVNLANALAGVLSNQSSGTHHPVEVATIEYAQSRFQVQVVRSDTAAPAAVMDLSCGTVTASSVPLTWTAPGDDGNTGTATTYDIRYSTSPITDANWVNATRVIGEPAPAEAGTVQSMTVDGLSADTTYYFAMKTADEVPNWSGLSNVISRKTRDTVAPAAVSDLAISSRTRSSITLTWTAPGDNGYSGTAGSYDIRYSTSAITEANWASALQVIGEPTPTAAGTNQSMVVSGLGYATTYYFAMKTSDTEPIVNVSALSNVVIGRTVEDPVPPAAVSDLSAGDPTVNGLTLTWTAPGDDDATGTATSYDIRYSTSTINDSNWASATPVTGEPAPAAAGTAQSMIVSGLSADTTYYFAMKTADQVANWSDLSNVASHKTSDTVAPGAVTDLATSGPTDTTIRLAWTAPGDNGTTGTASSYDIRYSTSSIDETNWSDATQVPNEPAPQAAGTAQSFTVTALSSSTTYHFAMKATDEAGNSSPLSNVVTGTTLPDDPGDTDDLPDPTPPAAIVNLGAHAECDGSIHLTWTAPGDDGGVGRANSYDIRFSESPISENPIDGETKWSDAIQVLTPPSPAAAGTAQEMYVKWLQLDTTYYFAMKTTDDAGNASGLSNVASTKTAATPAYAVSAIQQAIVDGRVWIDLSTSCNWLSFLNNQPSLLRDLRARAQCSSLLSCGTNPMCICAVFLIDDKHYAELKISVNTDAGCFEPIEASATLWVNQYVVLGPWGVRALGCGLNAGDNTCHLTYAPGTEAMFLGGGDTTPVNSLSLTGDANNVTFSGDVDLSVPMDLFDWDSSQCNVIDPNRDPPCSENFHSGSRIGYGTVTVSWTTVPPEE